MRHSVVFVPGMMLDGGMYAHQLAAFAEHGATSVADLTRGDSVETLARSVLATAPPRFALVGLSLGGIVAFEMLRQARERVTHLALLDTNPHADRPDRRASRLEQMASVGQGALAQVLETSARQSYLARRNRARSDLLDPILAMGLALGPDVFSRQSLALMGRKDSRDLLGSIHVPTLVLCGREDQLCPVDVHVDMAKAIPRADLLVLAETGHLSSMEEPTRVTAALLQWVQRG